MKELVTKYSKKAESILNGKMNNIIESCNHSIAGKVPKHFDFAGKYLMIFLDSIESYEHLVNSAILEMNEQSIKGRTSVMEFGNLCMS